MDNFDIENAFKEISKELNLLDDTITKKEVKEEKNYKDEIIKIEEYLKYINEKLMRFKSEPEPQLDLINNQLIQNGWENKSTNFRCRCKSNIIIQFFEKIKRMTLQTSMEWSNFDYINNSWISVIYCPKCGNRFSFQTCGEIKIYKIELNLMDGE